MGLMDMVTGALGMGLDRDYADDSFLASGQLTKAKLEFWSVPTSKGKTKKTRKKLAIGTGENPNEISFFLNPNKIVVSKELDLVIEKQTNNQPSTTKATTTKPISMDLGTIWFDTYDTRESVRKKYIDTLEKLMDPYDSEHHVPSVYFVWGEFSDSEKKAQYYFYVKKLDVTYEMFLPNGTPVRASVKIALQQCGGDELKTKFQSPDHAKLYTVRRGDTLQGISLAEYDDPREWRRIADSNGIVDPMSLTPGTKLLVPPILR